jgi:hypothetical protein
MVSRSRGAAITGVAQGVNDVTESVSPSANPNVAVVAH